MPPPYLRQCGMCKYSVCYRPPGGTSTSTGTSRHKQDAAVCRRAAGENMRDRKQRLKMRCVQVKCRQKQLARGSRCRQWLGGNEAPDLADARRSC